MIRRLSIEGLALIDRLEISFSGGFNVITGETGAGKSILIRALQFLLGAKVGPETIRAGAKSATVTAEFAVLPDHDALQILEGLGIEAFEDDGGKRRSILLRRQITQKGRAMAWANDTSITLPTLREIGTTLVDIFGQHENQRLLAPAAHTRYLDRFLAEESVASRYQKAWEQVQTEIRSIDALLEERSRWDRDSDYLDFRLKKLEEFAPSAEDYRTLKEFCDGAEAAVASRDRLGRALTCLDSDENGSVADRVKEAAKILHGIPQEAATDAEQAKRNEIALRLEAMFQEVEDIHFEVSKLFEATDFDSGELEEAQSRLFGYEELFRRHGVTEVEGLVEEYLKLQQQMELQKTLEDQGHAILKKLTQSLPVLIQSKQALTKARLAAAESIEKRVVQELADLAMKGADFGVSFLPVERSWPVDLWLANVRSIVAEIPRGFSDSVAELSKVGKEGGERAQFLLAANPGEPLLPLDKIASGGELSRILLALKKAIATDADTCVLVFDEIDTGVSGRVADTVGKKIRDLAGHFQVICISHLAQVAVYADCHFLVQKQLKGDRTETSIDRLDEKHSTEEIAKLLSAGEVSNPSLANARNLMKKARLRPVVHP